MLQALEMFIKFVAVVRVRWEASAEMDLKVMKVVLVANGRILEAYNAQLAFNLLA